MRKFVSLLLSGGLLSAMVLMASAAPQGSDMIDTFEYYKNSKVLSAEWGPQPSKAAIELTLDETTSAPNRGKGEAKGNYRSMKVKYDMSAGGWASFRNKTENPYPLENLVKNNGNGTFNFWAKADKKVTISAAMDIKDDPCQKNIEIGTTWKEYKINFRDLVPAVHERKDLDFIEITRQGLWPGGKQEAYLVGFKFNIISDQAGTLWMDSISISGDYIEEVQKFTSPDGFSYDTDYDELGAKPANFVPDKEEPTPTTAPPAPPPVSNNVTRPNSSTAPTKNSGPGNTTSGNASSEENSGSQTPTGVESDGSVQPEESSDSSMQAESSDASNIKTDTPEDKGGSPWVVILIVAIVVVLAGGACAFYFLYWKKRKISAE